MTQPLHMDNFDLFRIKGILKGRPALGPRSVNIHLNNICHRKCIFCWYFSPLVAKRERPRQLEFNVLSKLIRDCSRMGVQLINLEGGEVIHYPQLEKACRLVKAKGMTLAAYSHLAFSRDQLDRLRLLDEVNVNLSAASRKSYRIMHGDDSFNQVITNLKLLKTFKQRYGTPKITLTFIITKLNYTDIGRFIALALKLQVDELKFKHFGATEEMRRLLLSPEDAKKLKKILGTLLEKGIKIPNNLHNIYRVLSSKTFLKNRISLTWTRNHNDRHIYYQEFPDTKIRCFVGWFYSFIDEAGKVKAPCDNAGVCVAGNILHDSFTDIWFNSPSFARIREKSMHIDTTKKRWYECRYCGYKVFNSDMAARISIPGSATKPAGPQTSREPNR